MKPLRAFPFPLNVGTDICQISRIYKLLQSPRASRFINRVLAPEEQAWGDKRLVRFRGEVKGEAYDDGIGSMLVNGERGGKGCDEEIWKAAAFVAGRFAAKEAAIKAHSHRRLTFHDVLIERRGGDEERLGSGPPVARIRGGEGAEADESAMISISHDGDYATAVCIGHDPSVTASHSGSRDGG